jgi:DNA mismatch repair protein MutS2
VNTHALSVLEFPRVLDVVADRASSTLGAAAVRQLRPRTDREWLAGELARVQAMRTMLSAEGGWSPEPIPDVRQALARVRLEGAALDGTQLSAVAVLLRSSRRTQSAFRVSAQLCHAARRRTTRGGGHRSRHRRRRYGTR